MFIRIKKIKNQNYAYLVNNKWSKKKQRSKQQVVMYLGRVFKIPKIENNRLMDYFKINDLSDYVKKTELKKIILDLIILELVNHGFKQEGGCYVKEDLVFNASNLTVSCQKNKSVVLEINEGFLSKHTISNLLNQSTLKSKFGEELMFQFANLFVSAGLAVDKELFILVFQKMFKKG